MQLKPIEPTCHNYTIEHKKSEASQEKYQSISNVKIYS